MAGDARDPQDNAAAQWQPASKPAKPAPHRRRTDIASAKAILKPSPGNACASSHRPPHPNLCPIKCIHLRLSEWFARTPQRDLQPRRRRACMPPFARCAPAPPRVTWQLHPKGSKETLSSPWGLRDGHFRMPPPLRVRRPMLACMSPSRHQDTSSTRGAIALIPRDSPPHLETLRRAKCKTIRLAASPDLTSISGLVVEYIVAIDVTRVRFPADAFIALSLRRASPQRAPRMPRLICLAVFWLHRK